MTPLGTLQLIPAGPEHAQLLFDWHNEAGTRQGSRNSEPTPWADHVAWLEGVIDDPQRHLFVVLAGDTPIGQVRIDHVTETDAFISQAMDPAFRNRGLGAPTLVAAVAEAGDLGYERAVGVVRTDNPAMLRMVVKAGWQYDDLVVEDGIEIQRVSRPTAVEDDPRGTPVG
jgi:RimJ/RimL family protein N-acetyltransferase